MDNKACFVCKDDKRRLDKTLENLSFFDAKRITRPYVTSKEVTKRPPDSAGGQQEAAKDYTIWD